MDHWCGVGVFYHGEDTISTNLAFVTKRVLAAFLWEHYLKQCNYWILIFGPVNFKFFWEKSLFASKVGWRGEKEKRWLVIPDYHRFPPTPTIVNLCAGGSCSMDESASRNVKNRQISFKYPIGFRGLKVHSGLLMVLFMNCVRVNQTRTSDCTATVGPLIHVVITTWVEKVPEPAHITIPWCLIWCCILWQAGVTTFISGTHSLSHRMTLANLPALLKICASSRCVKNRKNMLLRENQHVLCKGGAIFVLAWPGDD